MTNVRIIVETGRTATEAAVEGLDTVVRPSVKGTLREAVERICRAYEITTPVWPEESDQ